MSALGHFRQIGIVPPVTACPLRSKSGQTRACFAMSALCRQCCKSPAWAAIPKSQEATFTWGNERPSGGERSPQCGRPFDPRNAEALSWALATMARASRGRPAASSSIALRKQAMARSAVRASSVGGMLITPDDARSCPNFVRCRLTTLAYGPSRPRFDGIFEIIRVVGRHLISIAEVHAIIARAHLAQGQPEMSRDRFGLLERHSAVHWWFRSLVASPPVRHLLLCTKHLFAAAMAAIACRGLKDERPSRSRRRDWRVVCYCLDDGTGAGRQHPT